MNSGLTKVWRRISVLLFPPMCPLCGTVTGSRVYGALCDNCRADFAKDYTVVCPRCKKPSDSCECVPDVIGSEYDRSPFTDVHPLIFDGFYTGYDGSSVSDLVYKMKRNRKSDAGILFAGIIAARISHEFTLRGISPAHMTVTFIPRSKAAHRKYGFDHMETVSKRVAEMLGCRYSPLILRKGGTDQKALTATERVDNANNSIFIDKKKAKQISGANLIVLDDIITTGSTMRTAVSKLSFAGARTIYPAAVMISKTNKRPPTDGHKF